MRHAPTTESMSTTADSLFRHIPPEIEKFTHSTNWTFFSRHPLIRSLAMQGVLTSREAWTRFACALGQATELPADEVAKEADAFLIQYLRRFPDPPEVESAYLTDEGMEFVEPPVLTGKEEDTGFESHD